MLLFKNKLRLFPSPTFQARALARKNLQKLPMRKVTWISNENSGTKPSISTQAIKLNGKNATYRRAAAYLELGSYLQAEVDCTAAINLDTEDAKACLWRGTARETLGNYKEATEDLKYALILEPTNKTANLALNRLRKLFK